MTTTMRVSMLVSVALLAMAAIFCAAVVLGAIYAVDIGRVRRRLTALSHPRGAAHGPAPVLPVFVELSGEIALLAEAEARRYELPQARR